MNLSSSSSTTFGIPFRCNKPATQVIQALDDKPSFLRVERKVIVLLPPLIFCNHIISKKAV